MSSPSNDQPGLPTTGHVTSADRHVGAVNVGQIRGAAAPPTAQNKRTDSGSWVEDHFLDLVALAAALIAFALGPIWLVLILAIAAAVAGIRLARADGRITGADVIAVPMQALGSLVRLLGPGRLIRGVLWLALAVVIAVALPAALAGVPWVLSRGSEGLPAAARLGVLAHYGEALCALGCFAVVRGLGPGVATRRAAATSFTKRMTEGGVTLLVGILLVVGAFAALSGRRTGDFPAGATRLSFVPTPFRSSVDKGRDAVVQHEIDELSTCLSRQISTSWEAIHSDKNPLADEDVALLILPTDEQLSAGQLQMALMAAQNQLAEWVDVIDIGTGGGAPPVARLDRSLLRHDVVITDPTVLLSAVVTGREQLGQPDQSIVGRALDCSAKAI